MNYVTLPATDLRVSTISLGTGPMGSDMDRDTAFALLDEFVEAGGTLLDTAHVYGDWLHGERALSEKTIGAWLRDRGYHDQVVIATKGAHPELNTMHIARLSADDIVADVDASLTSLGVDRIDLYYLHRDDPTRPVGEIMETLDAQVQQGKVRYLGCSNWQPARIAEAQAYARAHHLQPFVASQIFWSLATANPGAFPADHALMDDAAWTFYDHASMTVVAFSSQAHGFFSYAAADGVESLKPQRRKHFENPTNLARLQRAMSLAHELGVPVSAIVLSYIASQPFTSIPVMGPRTLDQLHDSLAGADLTLTQEQIAYLLDGDMV